MTTLRAAVDAACPPFLRGYKSRIEASSLASRLVRGAFWSLLGTSLSRSLGLVSSILVARMIGRVGLGELGIVQSTVGMFSTLAGLGLGLTATKHVAEHRAQNPALVGETIGLLSVISWTSGLLMTLGVHLLSPWLAQHTLAEPGLTAELRVGTLLLLFGVINGVQTGVLSGFEAFKTIARINFISSLASFPIMVCGAYFWGVLGAVWGLVVSLAMNCGMNFFAVRREAMISGAAVTYRYLHKHWNLLWRFGLPGMLAGLVSGPANWATSTMLVNQHGGYAEMGILNATNSWFQAVAFLPNLLGQVLLPILASYSATRDRGGVNRALVVATWTNFIVVLPVVGAGCAFSRYLMGLYGPGFAEGWPVLVMTLLSAGILMVQGPVTNQLIATSKMWTYFLAHVGWAAVFIAASFLWVPAYGSAGLALARLVAYAINGVVVGTLAWRYSKSDGQWAEVKS